MKMKLHHCVRLADPVHIAARFYKPDFSGIVGAGGHIIPRPLLDGNGFVVDIVKGTKATRGLIAFGDPDSDFAMWLDVNDLA